MRWSSEERAFCRRILLFESTVCDCNTFWNRFNVVPKDSVPDRKSIVTLVTMFRQTGSTTQRRTGVPRPIRSSENIEAVRALILQSPRRFARKHASPIGLSNRSVWRILHDDLHYHPYKMAIVQEISERKGRALHLMFHYFSLKVFLSFSLWASQLMFHFLSLKVFLSSNLRASHLMFHYLSLKVFLSSSLRASHLGFHYLS